jgi:hyperosmotically inducible periplasmic protein
VRHLAIIALLSLATACDKKSEADKPADNTKKNERDRDDATKTPGDQGQNKADIDITASIRKEVVGNGDLSTSAKNVKIISESGVVTLRGPVKTEDEKSTIGGYAQNTAGVTKVDNQLEIDAD